MERTINILFLCTGNSARSILAEALLNVHGHPGFRGFSAGSHPVGRVNPFALATLERHRIALDGFRSKSWDEFAMPDAPRMSAVITVCDSAAGETCPLWPGHPARAHWGLPDPAAATGSESERMAAFEHTFGVLADRIRTLTALPRSALEGPALKEALTRITHQ